MVQERIVALVDMDCFYVQVEQRRDPSLRGKPCAVVQYKKWRGGGIIAVGYEARKCGVTRSMRGDEAKEKCPDIHLVHVPENRDKADLTHYREAGAEVMEVLSQFCSQCERASIDEAYLDLTETVKKKMKELNEEYISIESISDTHIPGYENKELWKDAVKNDYFKMLIVGAMIVREMREAVFNKTGFTCSAGIAHNKVLAKLVAGLHKPNQQTLLPQSSVPELFKTIKIGKVYEENHDSTTSSTPNTDLSLRRRTM